MRHRSSTRAIVMFIGLITMLGYDWSQLVTDAQAIPAFARKYGFSCNVCHVPGFPKLNDTGNTFRDQGYQVDSERDLPTNDSISMGYIPISFRTTVGYQRASVRMDATGVTTGGFGFAGLDILGYGTLTRNIAFGVVYTPGLGSAGFGTGASDSDLEAAFVRLMRLEQYLGVQSQPGDYLLNVKVGKFELDVPFSEKRSQTLNTPFVLYHYSPGTPYTATISRNFARVYNNPNSFAIGENQPGLELTGIKKTAATEGYFRYSLAALTTNAFSGPLSGCSSGTTCGSGGRNVNFYGHVTQSFGGYGIVTGQRIGLFGAYGTAPTVVNAACPECQAVAGSGQPFYRIGGDASLTFDGQWNLFGALMYGNDSKNLFVSQGIDNAQRAAWYGAFVQLDWYPTLLPVIHSPGWLFSYRYDMIRNIQQGDPTFAKDYNNVNSHTFMGRYYLHQSSRTDIALHMEYNFYQTAKVGDGGGDLHGQTLLSGIDFAF